MKKTQFCRVPLHVVQCKEIWLQHSVGIMKQSTSAKKWVTYSQNTRKVLKNSIWRIPPSFWKNLNIFLHRSISLVYWNKMLEPYFLILHYMEGYSTKLSFFHLFWKSCDVSEMCMSSTLYVRVLSPDVFLIVVKYQMEPLHALLVLSIFSND